MLRFKVLIFLMATMLFSFSTSHSYTKVGRTKKKKNYSSKMEYSPISYNFIVRGNVGYIESKLTPSYELNNNMSYGFGFAGEYHTEGKHAFGINYDRLYKNLSRNSFNYKLLVQQYTVSWIYKFKTKRTSIPIATVHFGIAKPDIKRASSSKTVKIGFGFIGHTQSSINLRGLFYFQHFFLNEDLEKYFINGNLNVIGLDVMIGIPL